MTAREAYDCDSTFRALVDEWVRERRCPLPLVDRSLELDVEGAADCARWAATEPKRPTEAMSEGVSDETDWPYPGREVHNYYWWARKAGEDFPLRSRDVPVGRIHCHCTRRSVGSILDAILWLLDAWVPEFANAAA